MGLFGPPNVDRLRANKDLDGLVRALGHREELVRCKAAEALGALGDPRAVEPMIAVLRGEDRGGRLSAAKALGALGDPRAVEPLIAVLDDQSGVARWTAAAALGAIGDNRAVPPLILALADQQVGVRRFAAEALGKIGDSRAVEPLSHALSDESRDVRDNAAEALAEIGDCRALEPLVAALRNGAQDERAHLVSALLRFCELNTASVDALKDLGFDLLGYVLEEGTSAGQRQAWRVSIRAFEQALQIDASCAKAHCGLALACAAMRDMTMAREHYGRLQKLDPNLAAEFAGSPAGLIIASGGAVIEL